MTCLEVTAMKKRVLVLSGVLLGLGLVALVVWLFVPPKPGVTAENFHRLRRGMSEQEVEAILGKPGEATVSFTFGPDTYWAGEHSQVDVWFIDGRVYRARLLYKGDGQTEYLSDLSPSFWDRVRRSLPWEPETLRSLARPSRSGRSRTHNPFRA
jgi:hypothetical protein